MWGSGEFHPEKGNLFIEEKINGNEEKSRKEEDCKEKNRQEKDRQEEVRRLIQVI